MLKDTYLNNSLMPKRYMPEVALTPAAVDLATFEKLNNIKTNITSFVNDGSNLLICSNHVGCGKTTWATKMIKEYINQNENVYFSNMTPCLFINVNNFLNEKKLAITKPELREKINEIESNILEAKLVVFDDLCVKDISQFDLNSLYYWIDYRTSNLKSCIFTSNLEPSQLKNALDDRVYSRVVNYSTLELIQDGDNREGGIA